MGDTAVGRRAAAGAHRAARRRQGGQALLGDGHCYHEEVHAQGTRCRSACVADDHDVGRGQELEGAHRGPQVTPLRPAADAAHHEAALGAALEVVTAAFGRAAHGAPQGGPGRCAGDLRGHRQVGAELRGQSVVGGRGSGSRGSSEPEVHAGGFGEARWHHFHELHGCGVSGAACADHDARLEGARAEEPEVECSDPGRDRDIGQRH
mmetsp:Transcript_110276/g.351505  ORF Transcript_110276/g.351505 Transcript_110276/m.351505 type:complete len:207 (-) Transcript_110276:1235-1855(-)